VPNAQVRRRGAYAPLAATYFMDDDVMEAGEEAELLYVRGLAFCAGNPASDGYITDKQVARVVGAGMALLAERIQALVSVGLWERLPGGYAVRSWLKWNKSAEELGRHRARDRDRKSASSDTDRGSEDGPEPDPEDDEPGTDFHADSGSVPHGNETEGEVESEQPSGGDVLRTPDTDDLESVPLTQHNTTQHSSQNTPPSSPATPATGGEVDLFGEVVEEEIVSDLPNQRRASDWDDVDLNVDPDFRAFWDAYPRKVDKGHARKAWLTVMKKGGVDPSVIIAGAIRYRNDPDRKPDIKFTAHPATWLNGERWADYDEADFVTAGNTDEWWNN
jgi:hypothetical protein